MGIGSDLQVTGGCQIFKIPLWVRVVSIVFTIGFAVFYILYLAQIETLMKGNGF